MKLISHFHYITKDIEGYSHAELAEFACKGCADWVQLRVKNKSYNDWLKIALETKSICKKHHAKLIINDNVYIAKEIEADGVHLGKEDMNPLEARKILGNDFIIGGTANTFEDVEMQMKFGCDYVGLGPFRYTSTKDRLSPILGMEGIGGIVAAFLGKIPIIAIGGIRINDIKRLMNVAVHGIAVSSAINGSDNKTGQVKEFVAEISKFTDTNL